MVDGVSSTSSPYVSPTTTKSDVIPVVTTTKTDDVPRGSLDGTDVVEKADVTALESDGQPTLPPPRGSGLLIPEAAVRLSSFSAGATSIQQIAQLVMDQSLVSRAAARQDRQIARDADMQAQQAAADKVRDQAAFAFAASVVTSAISIAGAGMSMYGAAKAQMAQSQTSAAKATTESAAPKAQSSLTKGGLSDTEIEMTSMKSATSAASAAKTAPAAAAKPTAESLTAEAEASLANARTNPNSSAAANERLNARVKLSKAEDARRSTDLEDSKSRSTQDQCRRLADTWAARGQITTEVGKMAGAGLNFGAGRMEADKLEEQAKSSKARTAADDQTDFIRSYADNISAVLQKFAAIQEAQADTNRSIIRG